MCTAEINQSVTDERQRDNNSRRKRGNPLMHKRMGNILPTT